MVAPKGNRPFDRSVIPSGEDCYQIVRILPGEVLSETVDRYGKELREFRFDKWHKQVLCPYWRRSDYGTVRCEYLDKEVIDEDDFDALAKIRQRFQCEDPATRFDHSWELSDEIKICGIHQDADDAASRDEHSDQ